MTYEIQNGYFKSVNGLPVIAEPANMPHATWDSSGPKGIVFHYTVGCSNDIKGTLESNGFGGAHFLVALDGTIRQYAPLTVATWHCFHESLFFYGIEHTAYPGHGCELNDKQLHASALLSSALVEYMGKGGVEVPLKHLPPLRANDYRAGFHDHRDFDGDGQNSHTDHLYHWTWDQYLAEVQSTKDEEMYADFKRGVHDANVGNARDKNGGADYDFGFDMEQRATSNPKPQQHIHPVVLSSKRTVNTGEAVAT